MIEVIAHKIFLYIKKNKTLDYDDEIYIYGLEAVISTIIDTIIVLAVALVLDALPEALVFLIVFSLLRLFTGGYHAKSYLGCGVALMISFFTYLGFIRLLNSEHMLLYFIIMWGISLFLIFKYAPIDNINKPLDNNEKKLFKKKSIMSVCLLLSLSFIMFWVFRFLSLTITSGVFIVSILLAIEIIKKGGSYYEEN